MRGRAWRRALAPVLALTAIACGEGGERAQPEAVAGPISVVDDGGREVRLAKPATRVVSLLPHATDLIVALGATGQLVARTRYDTATAISHLPSVGGGLDPSIESIVALRPDLVLCWPDQGSQNLAVRLGELGLPVYTGRSGRMADVRPTLERLGRLLGREAAADSLAGRIERDVAAVRASVAGRPSPDVLFVMSWDPLMAAGGTTFIHDMLTAAGGRNVFGDVPAPAPMVSLEEVVRRQPDAVVFSREGGSPRDLRTLPGWRDLQAVREGRVLAVDANLVSRPGPQMGTAVRTLADWLHRDAP
jgi:iron complex transport system substrate-binding protein